MRTLLVAGRYEEAAEAARELFESCTEAGLQVGLCIAVLSLHKRQNEGCLSRPHISATGKSLQQALNSSKPIESDIATRLRLMLQSHMPEKAQIRFLPVLPGASGGTATAAGTDS